MFEVINSKDKLEILKSDFKKLLANPLDISLAEKTCYDAWHMADWVFEEQKQVDKLLTKEIFRIRLFKECPEMKILHDIANTFKHKTLDRPKTHIVKTKKHAGGFSPGFSKDFNVSRLEVYLSSNDKIDVDDLIQIAIDYWESKLS
ncbi:MAG: hypothetical protein HQ534_03280 [Armatimonadetes bacterium]|nr:hypothetical protein [Armatimonadota bacterium]